MKLRLLKVLYTTHYLQIDDDGNIIGEVSTGEPQTLFENQLDEFKSRITDLTTQVELQMDSNDA